MALMAAALGTLVVVPLAGIGYGIAATIMCGRHHSALALERSIAVVAAGSLASGDSPALPAWDAAMRDMIEANMPHNTIANFSAKVSQALQAKGMPPLQRLANETHILIVTGSEPGAVAAYSLDQGRDVQHYFDQPTSMMEAIARQGSFRLDDGTGNGNLTIDRFTDPRGLPADKWDFKGLETGDDHLAAMRNAGLHFWEVDESELRVANGEVGRSFSA